MLRKIHLIVLLLLHCWALTGQASLMKAGLTTWKFMGPDLNGVYGGLNGQGGFEAIVPGVDQFCPIVSDARGNLLCVNDPKHGGLLWNSSRPTGYGAVPGFKPPPLGHGRSLVEKCGNQ